MSSDLHDRLLATTHRRVGHDTSMGRALRAVVELHAPDSELPNRCAACCCSSWPCWTVRSIAHELGIEAAP